MRLTEAGLKLGMAAVLGLAVATGAVAQSAQQALSSESVIETIKKRGALKVGMSTFVPWAMRDKNGELVGFEIDVAKKLAADMDVDIEVFTDIIGRQFRQPKEGLGYDNSPVAHMWRTMANPNRPL